MNTLKNSTSKPESAYNNMSLYQISVIWRALDFGTKFIQKNMTGRSFEKNKHQNHNKHTTIYPCMKFQSFCRT